MNKINCILCVVFALIGCATADPFSNPSGTYSRSTVLNISGIGKVWSEGYIENKVFDFNSPIGLLGEIYIIGYKNNNLSDFENEKIAIYRGLEFGQSMGYQCVAITPEKTLADIERKEFNSLNSQGSISLHPSIDLKSIHGTINISRGAVYHFNRHRIITPDCKKTEGDMPGKVSCTYYPAIDHTNSFYAIYPYNCRSKNDIDAVSMAINKILNRDKVNLLNISEKIIEYNNLKSKLLGNK